jgi:hypothetical protein
MDSSNQEIQGSGQEKNHEIESDAEKILRTRFEQIAIDREADLFYSFLNRDRFVEVFDRVYPELRTLQNQSKDKAECVDKLRVYLEALHAEKHEHMVSAREYIQQEWDKINQPFLDMLAEHFQTDWPTDIHDIVGYVTALPVFPRFLDAHAFCVGFRNNEDMVETSAHEILHFLWFKKWKQVFPETKRQEFESPHLVWRLSEIMDPIILQCHTKIKELVKPRKWGYKTFEGIKIGDLGMTEYFKRIYLASIAAGDDFETTLKKLWEEAQKNEKEIIKF